MNRLLTTFLAALLLMSALPAQSDAAEGWKAGVARAVITPTTPMWMAGYATRDRPAEGKLHDLWAKAIVLEDASGKRVVLVTLDVCGIDRKLSNTIRDRLQADFNLGREGVAIAVSHTHSGPTVGDNLRAMNFLDATQQGYVNEYTKNLAETVIRITGDAIKSLAPAKLAWTNGTATFAVNRRENAEAKVPELREKGELKGPVDHDLPVMTVTSDDGKLVAILYGYACHGTTTSLYQWSGDWPAIASMEIEKAHPGTTALCWIGCAGDQNPLPRRSYKLLQGYGDQAAAGVEAAISSGKLKPIEPKLVTSYSEIDLPFAPLPTKEAFQADLKSEDKFVANRAKILLDRLEREGKLSTHYPYPIQLWRLGPELKWVLLGGEVTVEYSLRLKKELGPHDTWVGAYANDVMAYIPSLKVLKEGRYEGDGSMVYYCLPTKWAPEVEELIVKEVHRQVAESAK
jgi:hypothetical protein